MLPTALPPPSCTRPGPHGEHRGVRGGGLGGHRRGFGGAPRMRGKGEEAGGCAAAGSGA